MAERIAFMGRTESAAASISGDEYQLLITAAARRYLKRNNARYRQLAAKVERARASGSKKPVRTHARDALILPSWIGIAFEVHNGKTFVPIRITGAMLGHRLGEFSPTTKRVQHSAPGIRATRGSKFLAVK